MNESKCKNCGGDIAVRNPTGHCDHLHYPENVNESKQRWNKKLRSTFYVSQKGELKKYVFVNVKGVRSASIDDLEAFIEQTIQERDLALKQQIEWTIPIATDLESYVEIVKKGNMDKMYDYGFNAAKKQFLALLEVNEK